MKIKNKSHNRNNSRILLKNPLGNPSNKKEMECVKKVLSLKCALGASVTSFKFNVCTLNFGFIGNGLPPCCTIWKNLLLKMNLKSSQLQSLRLRHII